MPSYPSDLNDNEWEILRKLIPKPSLSLRGRPVSNSKRSIIDGILYIIRSGAAWRMMPNDLPHWKTCYHYFRIWAKQGVWLNIHEILRDQARLALGKKKPRPLRSSTVKVFAQLASEEFVVMMRVRKLQEGKGMPW